MNKSRAILFMSIIFPFCLKAMPKNNNPGLALKMLDSMALDIFDPGLVPTNNKGTLADFPDLFYEYRLAVLNRQTPIELEFDEQVKEYIYIFSRQRTKTFEKVIGLSELYFPIFEEYLDRYQLPFELKYLPIVESGLNPLARSSSGAVGLWQFKINAGKMFDLRVDSYLDERMDPYASTEAACQYLDYLYRLYKDWRLALVAYNQGPGVVRNILERGTGNLDYKNLIDNFPEEAVKYVSAFTAVNYLMNHFDEHGLVPVQPRISYYDTDTVHVKHPVFFSQIVENIDISMDLLKFLNPVYKEDYIPVYGHFSTLVLPSNMVVPFIRHEEKIYSRAYQTDVPLFHDKDEKQGEVAKKKIVHVVKKGEFLHRVALKYHCTIEEIITWNKLSGNLIMEGQELIIWVCPERYKILMKNWGQKKRRSSILYYPERRQLA